MSRTTGAFSSFDDRQYKKAKNRHLWGSPELRSRSVKVTCPNCRHAVDTVVIFEHTWKSAGALACFTLVGLCAVPALLHLWQDAVHYCPLCDAYLGHSQRRHTWQHELPRWVQCTVVDRRLLQRPSSKDNVRP